MLLTILSYAPKSVQRLFNREEGATLVEYGLLVALIAVVCIAGVSILGTRISSLFSATGASIYTAS